MPTFSVCSLPMFFSLLPKFLLMAQRSASSDSSAFVLASSTSSSAQSSAQSARRSACMSHVGKTMPGACMVLRRDDGQDEVKHIYKYRSSAVPWDAVLILHEIRGQCLCEFVTRGHMAPPHGEWRLSEDGGSLTSRFNYRFNADGTQNSETLPLHPTRVDRLEEGCWSGMDDKACFIELEHCRLLIRSGRFWHPTAPL